MFRPRTSPTSAAQVEDQVGAVEKDRLAGDGDDQAVLGRGRGLDVVFAEADVRIGHPGPDLGDLVADPADAGDLLAVQTRGDGLHQARDDERVLLVGFEDPGVNHLAGDVEEGRQIDRLTRLQQMDAARTARVQHADPLAARRAPALRPDRGG